MSIYIPKKLHVVETDQGWMVHDEFGPWEGPYASARDAYAVAADYNGDEGMFS